MATKQFGDKGQYTYNVDAKGNPYGNPISTQSNTTESPSPQSNLQTGGSNSDSFMSAIQEKLLGQSGIISSTNSQLEERLNAAISGIQTGAEKSNLALESAYGRERIAAEQTGATNIQNQLEGRSGFATQMVAFRNLVETTDKNLKDLEQRKNELILQNDSAAASKISDLQFKALEFQQQAQQQTFSNLLGIANFGLQSAQEKRLGEQQTFTEKKAMSDIALQYGLDIKPGETIDSITSKAMIFASEEQKVRLAKMNAEIRYTNAQTAKVLTGDGANKVVITPEITEKLATRWNELAANGATVDTSAEMENILGKYAKAGKESEFYDAISKQASDAAKVQLEAIKAKSSMSASPTGLKGLPKAVVGIGTAAQHGSANFVNWLTGSNIAKKI